MTTKITPDFKFDSNNIGIEKMSITYIQEADSNSDPDEPQVLEISTDDAGGGFYYNIKTDRWSIDSGNHLQKLIEDFESRLNIETSYEDISNS